jgi:hypothetical protein
VLFVAWMLEELIIMEVEIKDDKRPAYLVVQPRKEVDQSNGQSVVFE